MEVVSSRRRRRVDSCTRDIALSVAACRRRPELATHNMPVASSDSEQETMRLSYKQRECERVYSMDDSRKPCLVSLCYSLSIPLQAPADHRGKTAVSGE